jgi:FKBP-type peptidyl-prolyl cis-trans isomerase FkpA
MKLNQKLVALSIAISAVLAASSCTKKETTEPSAEASPAANAADTSTAAAANGAVNASAPAAPAGELKIEDSVVGKGAEAVAGKKVTVHYTGKLTDGKQFDSSVGKEPFTFTLGAGEVISGWDKGVAGMKIGGKRKLTIPPEMAYGTTGAGSIIPPNATLMFDVELLKVQ